MKIIVYHGLYGCDTGCCGHWVEFYPDETDKCYSKFEFEHCDEDQKLEFARELAEDFIAKHHPQCLSTIDWSTLQFQDVQNYDCDNF